MQEQTKTNGLILAQVSTDELAKTIATIVANLLKQHEGSSAPATLSEEPELISREEAKNLLRVSYPTLHVWTQKGLLQGYRIGRCIRYRKEEVLQALKEMPNRRNSGSFQHSSER